MDLMIQYLTQLALTVGVVFVFGLLIAICRRSFCRIVGYYGPRLLLITGVVGTPIHELSHALMCILFGHKILEIKLYQPDSEDGVLGYVQHSYNPRNIYQQIGNFFIGIAPILCGSGVLLLLLRWLAPESFNALTTELAQLSHVAAAPTFSGFLKLFEGMITAIFNPANLSNVRWWIFILLALLIASHMELSGADIKGGIAGLFILLLLWFLVDMVIFFISVPALKTVTAAVSAFGLAVAGFLAISGIFSLTMVALALTFKIIGRLFH